MGCAIPGPQGQQTYQVYNASNAPTKYGRISGTSSFFPVLSFRNQNNDDYFFLMKMFFLLALALALAMVIISSWYNKTAR